MFRTICSVLIAFSLPGAAATGEAAKVRHIVSLLQDVSSKLAIERAKEDLVYAEIKRYCHDGVDDSSDSDAAPEAADAGKEPESSDDDNVELASNDASYEDDEDESHLEDDSIVASDDEDDFKAVEDTDLDTDLQTNKVAVKKASDNQPAEMAVVAVPTSPSVPSKVETEASSDVHVAAEKVSSLNAKQPRQESEKQEAQVQQSITKFTPELMVDGEDPSQVLERMNRLLIAENAAKSINNIVDSPDGSADYPEEESNTKQVPPVKEDAAKVVPKQTKHHKSLLAAKQHRATQQKLLLPPKAAVRTQQKQAPVPAKAALKTGKATPRQAAHQETHPVARPAHKPALQVLEHAPTAAKPVAKPVAKREAPLLAQPAHKQSLQAHAMPAAKSVAKKLESKPTNVSPQPPAHLLKQDESNALESLASPVESLADVVQAAVATADQSLPKTHVQPELVPMPSKKIDSAVANLEPLANSVLSIEDTAVDDADGGAVVAITPQKRPAPVPPKHVQQAVKKSEPADPKAAAVQSEFDETAKQVARLEEDLGPPPPAPETPAATLRRLDPAIFTAAAAQAKQKENNEINVAAIHEAFGDIGVAIPDIDQEAKELYKTFGEEHESDSGAAPAFLQTDKHQTFKHVQAHKTLTVKHQRHHMAKSPVLQADVDAAVHALKDVARDTEKALSMMDLVRHTEGNGQCALLMKKFEHRKAVRTKREAELEKRSQELQEALRHSHTHSGKTKHLRSRH